MTDILIIVIIGLSLILVLLIAFIAIKMYTYRCLVKELRLSNDQNSEKELRVVSQDVDCKLLASEINTLIRRIKVVRREADDKDKSVRDAIENMSHDLRTPLTSLKGYFALLNSDGISDAERREYCEVINKKIESLEKLTGTFFELSKLQNDDYELVCERIDIGNLIIESIAASYTEFDRVQIEPEFETEDNVPQVFADKFAAERIVNNIISNAIKYSEGDFRIKVYKKDDSTVVTEFSNKAVSVDEESAKHLTERFFLVDRTRTGQSTGIGLALVDNLVKRMGNTVSVEKKGDDLVFTIEWNTGVAKE